MNADRRQGLPLAAEAPDTLGAYPAVRMRRNRRDAWTRRLVAENTLTTDDLIWPIFVIEGTNDERAVASMPGQVRVTVDRLAKHVEKAVRLGVPALALFPVTPPEAKDAVDKARELVKAGQGSEKLAMDDLNQGKRQSIRMSADVLWSYFDPAGLGHMPGTAASFKKPVPFLWVIGTNDPLYAAGEDFAYRKAPDHPASKYLVVSAGHIDTPDVAAAQVLEWLRGLP